MNAAYETMSRSELATQSHAGDKLATLELERRSHVARHEQAVAWVLANLDRVIEVAGPTTFGETRGWAGSHQIELFATSLRGKVRDLLSAGQTVQPAAYLPQISAAEVADHGGSASAVEVVRHEPVWVKSSL